MCVCVCVRVSVCECMCVYADWRLCVHVCVYVSRVRKNRLPKVMLFSEMKKRPAQISHGHTLVLHRGAIAFSLNTLLKRPGRVQC